MKLSDTQLMILSAASQRDDHAAVQPANLKGNSAKKVIGKLVSGGLLQELRASGGVPVWRRDDDNVPLALGITKAGLKAIAVDHATEAASENDGSAGGELLQAARANVAAGRRASRSKPAHKRTSNRRAKLTKRPAVKGTAPSKQDSVIALLQRPDGATLAALVKATGWQPHSVRGFLAGTVRKKLKLSLSSEKIDGIRTYRIKKTAKRSRAA